MSAATASTGPKGSSQKSANQTTKPGRVIGGATDPTDQHETTTSVTTCNQASISMTATTITTPPAAPSTSKTAPVGASSQLPPTSKETPESAQVQLRFFLDQLLSLVKEEPLKNRTKSEVQGLIDGYITKERFSRRMQRVFPSKIPENLLEILTEGLSGVKHSLANNEFEFKGIRKSVMDVVSHPLGPSNPVPGQSEQPTPIRVPIETTSSSSSPSTTSGSLAESSTPDERPLSVSDKSEDDHNVVAASQAGSQVQQQQSSGDRAGYSLPPCMPWGLSPSPALLPPPSFCLLPPPFCLPGSFPQPMLPLGVSPFQGFAPPTAAPTWNVTKITNNFGIPPPAATEETAGASTGGPTRPHPDVQLPRSMVVKVGDWGPKMWANLGFKKMTCQFNGDNSEREYGVLCSCRLSKIPLKNQTKILDHMALPEHLKKCPWLKNFEPIKSRI